MKKSYGFELCADQLLDRIGAEIGIGAANAPHWPGFGDTPIERLFCFALYQSVLHLGQEWFTDVHPVTAATLEDYKSAPHADTSIIIERQAQLEGWRVDFLIHVNATWARNPDDGMPGWKQLIVECDGHDFHERTKEQAAKDRARDREFQLKGIDVFRFTGSELWKDPLGCADQVISWANKRV